MNELKHYGVKGMRWGVHKASKRVNETLKSRKREHSWKKELKNINYMTTEQMNAKARQISLENEFKRLSYSRQGVRRIGNKEDRKNYRRRGDMTHEELTQVVNRLRAKHNLHRAISEATRAEKELGKRVAALAGTLGIKYATGQSIKVQDVARAYGKPKKAAMGMFKENQKVKDFMDKEIVKEKKKKKES